MPPRDQRNVRPAKTMHWVFESSACFSIFGWQRRLNSSLHSQVLWWKSCERGPLNPLIWLFLVRNSYTVMLNHTLYANIKFLMRGRQICQTFDESSQLWNPIRLDFNQQVSLERETFFIRRLMLDWLSSVSNWAPHCPVWNLNLRFSADHKLGRKCSL